MYSYTLRVIILSCSYSILCYCMCLCVYLNIWSAVTLLRRYIFQVCETPGLLNLIQRYIEIDGESPQVSTYTSLQTVARYQEYGTYKLSLLCHMWCVSEYFPSPVYGNTPVSSADAAGKTDSKKGVMFVKPKIPQLETGPRIMVSNHFYLYCSVSFLTVLIWLATCT